MFENMTEKQAREEILASVEAYCDAYHRSKAFTQGDGVPYARRVYDHEEMASLVDSALDFWLTAGRYSERFETEFAAYLGVGYASLVNSGSSANLLAFMALTSPLLGGRGGPARRRSDHGRGGGSPPRLRPSFSTGRFPSSWT